MTIFTNREICSSEPNVYFSGI